MNLRILFLALLLTISVACSPAPPAAPPVPSGPADFTVVGKQKAQGTLTVPHYTDVAGAVTKETIYVLEITTKGVTGKLEVTEQCYRNAVVGETLEESCRTGRR